MSQHVFEGDEWKHAPEPPGPRCIIMKRRTRAEQQAYADDAYGKKRITLLQWQMLSEMCSNEAQDGRPL